MEAMYWYMVCSVSPLTSHPTSHHHTPTTPLPTTTLPTTTPPTTALPTQYSLRIQDAAGYITFVLDSILSKELFHSLALKPVACWGYLLWMDQVGGAGEAEAGRGTQIKCVCLYICTFLSGQPWRDPWLPAPRVKGPGRRTQ